MTDAEAPGLRSIPPVHMIHCNRQCNIWCNKHINSTDSTSSCGSQSNRVREVTGCETRRQVWLDQMPLLEPDKNCCWHVDRSLVQEMLNYHPFCLRHKHSSGTGFQRLQHKMVGTMQDGVWHQNRAWANFKIYWGSRWSFWNYAVNCEMVCPSATRALEPDDIRPVANEHTVHRIAFTLLSQSCDDNTAICT